MEKCTACVVVESLLLDFDVGFLFGLGSTVFHAVHRFLAFSFVVFLFALTKPVFENPSLCSSLIDPVPSSLSRIPFSLSVKLDDLLIVVGGLLLLAACRRWFVVLSVVLLVAVLLLPLVHLFFLILFVCFI